MLIDSHCHLDFESFSNDIEEVLKRAEEAGVSAMQTICTRLSHFEDVLSIAKRYPNIWCSVGVHPHNVTEEKGFSIDDILNIVNSNKEVIGIGETGLDFYYENSPRDQQISAFRVHLQAARKSGLPAIIHTREADRETCQIIEDEWKRGAFPGVIHCFSGGQELAELALKLDFYISISGIITFKNADKLRDVVKRIPLDHLLVETDSPYLAPVPHRGKRNEPAFTLQTAEFLAQLLGVEFERLEGQIEDNFYKLFSKAKPIRHSGHL